MSKYQYLWGNYQAHWTIELNLFCFLELPNFFHWNQAKNIIQVSRDNRISTFHSREDLQEDQERGKIFLDENLSVKFLQDVKQRCTEHRAFFTSLKNIPWQTLSDRELMDLVLQARKQWQLTISYFRPTQMEGMHYLLETIRKHCTDEDASLLLTPIDLDVLNQEQLEWQEILQQPYSESRMISHVEKYPWLLACHFTMNDVVGTLSQRYAYDSAHQNYNDVPSLEKKELQQKQEAILSSRPELRPLVYRAQQLAMSRMEVKSCWAGTEFYTLPLFAEIAQRTAEDIYDLSKYYVSSEIQELLLEKKALSAEEKERRKKCFVGLLKDGNVVLKSGEEAESLAKQELGDLYELKETNELTGKVANPGKVVGVVRILQSNNFQQNNELRRNFKKGDILITQMTQPNIVDIASRAGAIVTEEGGLLSHAAIISREFKIPCIVGCLHAMTTLEDGDLIEVDANTGIVRKLEI